MVLVLRTFGAHASHGWCLPRTRHEMSYNTINKDGWEEVYLPHCELLGRLLKNCLCVKFL